MNIKFAEDLEGFVSQQIKIAGYPDTRTNRLAFLKGVLLGACSMDESELRDRVIVMINTEVTKIKMEMHFGLD